MKPSFRGNWYVAAAWLVLLGSYSAVCVWVPAGEARITAANLILCLMPLVVNGALLINAVSPDWRIGATYLGICAASAVLGGWRFTRRDLQGP